MAIQAKSVVFDFADNHGDAYYMGIRSIDFYLGTSKISLTTNFTAYNSSRYDASYQAAYAFNTSLSKIGSEQNTSWLSFSGNETEQRLIIVFDSVQLFSSIVINSFHSSGTDTIRGPDNTVITTTLDTYTTTTYNDTVTNGEVAWSGTLDEHTASDVEDEQTIDLSNKLEFSFSQLDFTCRGLVGEAVLSPILPCLSPSIEGTFHTPGLITALLAIDVAIEGSFIPNTVELEFDLPALTFEGNITTNKIHLSTDLPVFSPKLFSGAYLAFDYPKLSFSGVLEATKNGNINLELPLLAPNMYSGSYIAKSFPSISIDLSGEFSDFQPIITSEIAFFIPSLNYNSFGESSIGSILTTAFPKLFVDVLSQDSQDQILRYIKGAIR